MDEYDIFVYCGGKCGSKTIQKSFENNGYKTCHLHNNYYWMNNLKNSIPIFDIIDRISKEKKIYIIDCYRRPIERGISGFFQNISNRLPNYDTLTVHEIINWFNNNQEFMRENYHPINEILEHYNLPLFEKFDFNKRYNIIEKDNKVFIKILFSDIDKWETIFSEIIGNKITISSDNLTESKNTYNLYNEFKKYYVPPIDYVDFIATYDREFFIYNTQKEQEEYIEKWVKITKL